MMGPGPFCGRVMAGYAHWSRVKRGGLGSMMGWCWREREGPVFM